MGDGGTATATRFEGSHANTMRSSSRGALAAVGAAVGGTSSWNLDHNLSQDTFSPSHQTSQTLGSPQISQTLHASSVHTWRGSTGSRSFRRSKGLRSSGASLLGQSASTGTIGTIRLPKIHPQALSFDEIYRQGRKRLASKLAEGRAGGEVKLKASPRDILDSAKHRVYAVPQTAKITSGSLASLCSSPPPEDDSSGYRALEEGSGSVDPSSIAGGRRNSVSRRASKQKPSQSAQSPTAEENGKTSVKARLKMLTQQVKTFNEMRDKQLVAVLTGPDVHTVLARNETNGFPDAEVARMRAAYVRFKPPENEEIHKDDLNDTLQHLGYLKSSREICGQLVEEMTQYATLDFVEYVEFVDKFATYERELFQDVFDEYDKDRSGSMSVEELAGLLKSLGITPLKKTLDEAVELVDRDNTGTLSFNEFVHLLAIYRISEGFTRKEISDLHRIFTKFSVERYDGLRQIEAEQLNYALLDLFGPQASQLASELAAKVIEVRVQPEHTVDDAVPAKPPKEENSDSEEEEEAADPHPEWIDYSKPRPLDFQEFLVFGRRLREAELAEYGRQFAEFADARSGKITREGLPAMLSGLGYTSLPSMIDELLSHVDSDGSGSIEFDEFVELMAIFRSQDGFSRLEVEEFREAFDTFDRQGDQEISTTELLELLRRLGYMPDREEALRYVAEVDYNGSGFLDFRELLRLMRRFREQELTRLKFRFQTEKTDGKGHEGRIAVDKLIALLWDEGYQVDDSFVKTAIDEDTMKRGMAFHSMVGIVDEARRHTVRKIRRQAGFTDREIAHFVEMFSEYDKDRNGDISSEEMTALVADLGMPLRTVPERMAFLSKVDEARAHALSECIEEEEAGKEGDPKVPFWVFVHLIRLVQNERDAEAEARDEEAMKETNFSPAETAQFREVFNYWVSRTDLYGNDAALTSKKAAAPAKKKKKRDKDALKPRQELVGGNNVGGLADPYLPIEGLRRVLRSFGCSLTPSDHNELEMKVLEMESADDNGRIDFQDFLRIMRWLLNTNFARANTAAAQATVRSQSPKAEEA